MDSIKEILLDVENELDKATMRFNKFNTYHEGYAVIKEELDELWDEIKGKQRPKELYEEAKQVCAMALRFIVDCI